MYPPFVSFTVGVFSWGTFSDGHERNPVPAEKCKYRLDHSEEGKRKAAQVILQSADSGGARPIAVAPPRGGSTGPMRPRGAPLQILSLVVRLRSRSCATPYYCRRILSRVVLSLAFSSLVRTRVPFLTGASLATALLWRRRAHPSLVYPTLLFHPLG